MDFSLCGNANEVACVFGIPFISPKPGFTQDFLAVVLMIGFVVHFVAQATAQQDYKTGFWRHVGCNAPYTVLALLLGFMAVLAAVGPGCTNSRGEMRCNIDILEPALIALPWTWALMLAFMSWSTLLGLRELLRMFDHWAHKKLDKLDAWVEKREQGR